MSARVSVARKTLLEEPFRFALAVSGVALAIVLILVLTGMYVGINEQITAYLDHAPADLVVAQRGLRNLLGARSTVPSSALRAAREVDGVEGAVPVIVQYVVLELRGRKEFTLLVGFDPEQGGGPWEVTDGTSRVESGEVVLDEALARLRGLDVGDRMDILGRRFEIAGLSEGTSSFMTGTVFLTYDDVAPLVAASGPSFVLVDIASGADASVIAERVEDLAGPVTVSTREQVDRNDIELYASILRGPVGFMVAVASLVGVMLVGLTTYTSTVERAKEYGTLKAIGVPNRLLYAIVLKQAGMAAVTGTVLGIGVAFLAAEGIEYANPRFLIAIGLQPVVAMALVALAIGALAALAPAMALARIEPATAFRRGA